MVLIVEPFAYRADALVTGHRITFSLVYLYGSPFIGEYQPCVLASMQPVSMGRSGLAYGRGGPLIVSIMLPQNDELHLRVYWNTDQITRMF